MQRISRFKFPVTMCVCALGKNGLRPPCAQQAQSTHSHIGELVVLELCFLSSAFWPQSLHIEEA